MQWNCPHCGTTLAVPDEKIGTGWAFSRCYKCAGHALVRRSDVNLIKVDRAPPGEQVLLPSHSENPQIMLSETATQNLARYFNRAEATKVQSLPEVPLVIPPRFVMEPARIEKPVPPAPQQAFPPMIPPGLPELPEKTDFQTAMQRFLPFGIGMAGALAVFSGVYLFLQGQSLWKKTRASAPSNSRIEQPAHLANKEYEPPEAQDPISNPKPIQVAKTYKKSPSQMPVHPETSGDAITDQIQRAAMAPIREPVQAVEPAPVKQVPPADQEVAPDLSAVSVTVKPVIEGVKIHSGPGSDFSVIALADPKQEFIVSSWKDRWFRIVIQERTKDRLTQRDGWVRNDLVQLVSR